MDKKRYTEVRLRPGRSSGSWATVTNTKRAWAHRHVSLHVPFVAPERI